MNPLQYELSADDIIRVIKRFNLLFSRSDIIEYPQLIHYNLELLLPHQNDFKIVFFITNQMGMNKEGHWCVLARKNNKFVWFDPYGLTADSEKNWINVKKRREYGENEPILHEIVPKGKLEWNHFDYQKQKQNVNTCGRWCCFFAYFCCFLGHTLNEMQYFIKQQSRLSGLSYDCLICRLVPI
jgi:hypothetical protein